MSKIYKVTVSGLAPDVWEMIAEVSDALANTRTEPALENLAKEVSEEAIFRRWQKMNPNRTDRPNFVQSFSVELLPDFDVNNVTGIGPYQPQTGVRVWMTNGPLSFGVAAPRHLQHGGAW